MATRQRYQSIKIRESEVKELKRYNSSLLTPVSRGVYRQWRDDGNDQLLVSGYFRECGTVNQLLPYEVHGIIAAYYTKQFTKSVILKRIMTNKAQMDYDNRMSEEEALCDFCQAYLAVLFVFALLVMPIDLAALTIVTGEQNDCALTEEIFLNIGGWVNIIGSLVIYAPNMIIGFSDEPSNAAKLWTLASITVALFTFAWCIYGCVLHATMTDRESHQTCTAMLLAWVIYKFLLLSCQSIVLITLIENVFERSIIRTPHERRHYY